MSPGRDHLRLQGRATLTLVGREQTVKVRVPDDFADIWPDGFPGRAE